MSFERPPVTNKEIGSESFDEKRTGWLSGQVDVLKANYPHLYAGGLTTLSALASFGGIETMDKAFLGDKMPAGVAAALGTGAALSLYRLFLLKARRDSGEVNE